MTVKCIPAKDQESLVYCYKYCHYKIEDLMRITGKSRRTVQRMLEDAGLEPIKHRRHYKTKAEKLLVAKQESLLPSDRAIHVSNVPGPIVNRLQFMDLLESKRLDEFIHTPLVIPTKTPWYRKVIQTVIRPFL